jgi:hypothetical protein
MKLTYWVSERLDDSNCYNIRTKTKKEALAKVLQYSHGQWGAVHKVEIEYKDAFDLMLLCCEEGGAYWE